MAGNIFRGLHGSETPRMSLLDQFGGPVPHNTDRHSAPPSLGWGASGGAAGVGSGRDYSGAGRGGGRGAGRGAGRGGGR
eukprot:2042498-Rhodomonas_salina.1